MYRKPINKHGIDDRFRYPPSLTPWHFRLATGLPWLTAPGMILSTEEWGYLTNTWSRNNQQITNQKLPCMELLDMFRFFDGTRHLKFEVVVNDGIGLWAKPLEQTCTSWLTVSKTIWECDRWQIQYDLDTTSCDRGYPQGKWVNYITIPWLLTTYDAWDAPPSTAATQLPSKAQPSGV